MSPNVQFPDNIASVLADLQSRLIRLETNRPSPPQLAPPVAPALTLVSSQSQAGYGPGAFNTAWQTFWQPTFTLTKISDVLVTANVTFYADGGTANFDYVGYSIDGGGQTGFGVHTLGSGLANASFAAVFPALSAATHTLKLWYKMLGGAASVFHTPADTPTEINVFALSAGGAGTVAIP